jgi:hypothetical protein
MVNIPEILYVAFENLTIMKSYQLSQSKAYLIYYQYFHLLHILMSNFVY